MMVIVVRKINDDQWLVCENNKSNTVNKNEGKDEYGGEFLAGFVGKDEKSIVEAFKAVFGDEDDE